MEARKTGFSRIESNGVRLIFGQWVAQPIIEGFYDNQAGGGNTPKFEKKNLDTPDERRSFENGKIDVVTIGGLTMGRMTFQPGWRWSKHVKPVVKTNSCQARHVGFVVSGRLKTVLDDGTEGEVGPGDAYDIPPGHDGWVVGDSPVVMFELMSAAQYAKK